MSAATRRWIGWTGVCAVGVYLAYDGYDEVLADLSASLHLWRSQSLRFWMVILFPWAFAAGSVMVCSVCLTVLSFRRRVFVSFHHSQERVADDLSSALSRAGLKVSRIPFDPDHQHDRLLKRVLDEIRRCDVVVCLPGPLASFVENEILAASTLRKLIIFVVGEDAARLPNTALYGYPVFRLSRVQRRRFEPVSDLVLLGVGGWRATLRHLRSRRPRSSGAGFDGLIHSLEATVAAFLVAFFGYVLGVLWVLAVDGVGEGFAFALAVPSRLWELVPVGAWQWILLLYIVLVSVALTLENQLRARRVLKQTVLTGNTTRESLRGLLGHSRVGRRILASLWKQPPRADHEASVATR